MTATVPAEAIGSPQRERPTGSPAPRRPRVLITAAAVLLAVSAEIPLLRVFGLPGIRLILLAAPIGGIATAIGLRLGPVPGLIAGLVAGALPGILIAPADPFTPASLGPRLWQAVTDGWYRLLSVPVPVPFTRSFTDLPYLVAALLAALIMLIALGNRPSAALVPATLGFGGLLLLGVSGTVASMVIAGEYGGSVLLFMAIAAPSVPPRTALRGAVGGVGVVVAATLVAGGVHAGRPYNPRASQNQPVNVSVSQDPMALIPALLATPNVRVLTARLTGALLGNPRNWVLLIYDAYDGEGWQAPGNARPAVTAGAVPGATQTGGATVTTTPQTVLPHPPSVLGTSPADLSYDPDSELLASPTAISTYTVHTWVTDPGADALSVATVPSDVPATLSAVPSCAQALLAPLAQQVRSAAGLPGVQAALLAKRLSSAPYSYAPKAPPGEGCASIANLFDRQHRGTSAQFATVFALTARLLGIPARVAVGYLPGHVASGVDTVTDGDAYAWAQVEFTGLGWVDFDPTPRDKSAKNPPVYEKQAGVQKLENTRQPKPGPSGPAHAMPLPPVPPGLSTTVRAFLVAGPLVLVVLAWAGAAWLWGARRRIRRRRASSPADRVLGAWDELLLPLRQAGMQVRGLSASGVASAAAKVLPPSQTRAMAQLAELTELAIYSGDVGDRDADLAWQLSDRLRRPVLAAASRWTRLRRAFLASRDWDS
jgi:transglutaminase-like putative cysteine protease